MLFLRMGRYLFLCLTAIASAHLFAFDRLAQMTLDEKIGQLFMVAAVDDPVAAKFGQTQPYRMEPEWIEHLITEHHIGGIVFLGLGTGTVEKQRAWTQRFQQASKIPLLIGQDFEWGLSQRLQNTIRFPHAMTLGALALDDEELIYKLGYEIGTECRAIGVHINFAPVVDVNSNPDNPVINDRAFGDEPAGVARKAILFMRGMQAAGILTCAKHFPGHGDTAADSHTTLPTLNHPRERLQLIELAPFRKLIDANVDSIMTAHLKVPTLDPASDLPASLSYAIVTKILRKAMKFDGLIITDGLGMHGVTKDYNPGELELKALMAGNDILLMPIDVPAAIATIKQAVADGTITEALIDEHVTRILQAKEKICGSSLKTKDFEPITTASVNSPAAYALQTKLYQKTLTCVKNEKEVLPLAVDNTPAALICIGAPLENEFHTTLKAYCSVMSHAVPYDASTDVCMALIPKLKNVQTVIVSIHGAPGVSMIERKSQETARNLFCDMERFIAALRNEGKKVVVVSFESPYYLHHYANAHALLAAYESMDVVYQAAALAVVGKIEMTGRLPVTLA